MYTCFLTEVTAQMIADHIMQSIPYNVNIMDQEGRIIASGHKERIGTVHKGALRALEMKKPYIVYEDTRTERKGINLPIEYNQELVGVIGISGEPEQVMAIGQIVVSTARLMIYNDMAAIKESRQKDFFYEWSQLKREEYGGKFLAQAQYFGVDLTMQRTAVIITSKRIRYSVMDTLKRMLEKDEYILRQGMEETVVLFRSEKRLEKRLEKVLDMSRDFTGCYVGESSVTARDTCRSAGDTCELACAMGISRRIVYFKELSLECLLGSVEVNRELEELMRRLEECGEEGGLLETIVAYAAHTGSMAQVCEVLHIHRNTLNYRLGRLEELTGYQPRCMRDLMMLYLASIHLKRAGWRGTK